jgi:hypothetical protein
VDIRWHKSRWYCAERLCPRTSFTEQTRLVPSGSRLTAALRREAGRAVADGGRTVLQTCRDLGISWPTAQAALQLYAERALPAEPEASEAIGIDETGRGKPVWRQDPENGKWELVADAWHIGFVDAVGGRGLFGQVEGRTADSVATWLSLQSEHWKQQVIPEGRGRSSLLAVSVWGLPAGCGHTRARRPRVKAERPQAEPRTNGLEVGRLARDDVGAGGPWWCAGECAPWGQNAVVSKVPSPGSGPVPEGRPRCAAAGHPFAPRSGAWSGAACGRAGSISAETPR